MKYKDAVACYVERKKRADLPTLTVANKEYLVVLGQWLGEFNHYIEKRDKRKYVDANYIIRKKLVTEEDLEIVIMRLANLLKMVGISEDNICFLDNFRKDKITEMSFDCYLYNTGEVINMKVTEATINNCPELIIERNGVTIEYEHWYCKHDTPDRLGIQAIYRNLNEDGTKKSFFYTVHDSYHGEVTDKDNKLEIDIQYPENYESTDLENPYVDYDKLEKLLSEVVFPVDFKLLEEKIKACLKMNSRKYEINLRCLYNGEILTYSFPECIKIYEHQRKLALCIGDWMEAYSPIMREYLPAVSIRKKALTQKGINEISRHFSDILKMAGLSVNQECDLMYFDKDNLTFECVFDNDDAANIKLIVGTEEFPLYKILIEYKGVTKLFTYHKGYEDGEEIVPDSLHLDYFDKETEYTDTRFRYDFDLYTYFGKAYNDEGRLEISINCPRELFDPYSENDFIDGIKLERLISTNCEFPVDIVYLYRKVLECLKQDPHRYGINIRAVKCKNNKEYVTDAISCRGNLVSEFTITKRWRTITVKPNGVWNYDSAEWKVSQNLNRQISYTLNDIVADESKMEECATTAKLFAEAKKEADEVRKLAKSLVQHK